MTTIMMMTMMKVIIIIILALVSSQSDLHCGYYHHMKQFSGGFAKTVNNNYCYSYPGSEFDHPLLFAGTLPKRNVSKNQKKE